MKYIAPEMEVKYLDIEDIIMSNDGTGEEDLPVDEWE